MYERRVTIGSPAGLHARPASLFTQTVNDLGADVAIRKEDGHLSADAGSILGVMGLGIQCGDVVVLTTPDPESLPALDQLAEMLTNNLEA